MISNFLSMIGRKLIMMLGHEIILWLEQLVKEAKRSHEQKIAKKELDKISLDPNKSLEEIGKANENLINSGR